jgi:hypothetical protein
MGNAGHACALQWLIAFAFLLHTGQSEAASQGPLGSTSSGSVSITVSVPTQARVSGLEDIAFAAPDTDGALTGSQTICVSSNSLARSFSVAVIGSGPEGSLELSNGSRTAAYSVKWSLPESRNPGSRSRMTSQTANLDAPSSEIECRSGRGLGRLTVAVHSPGLGGEWPEVPYSGTLTVILSPQ